MSRKIVTLFFCIGVLVSISFVHAAEWVRISGDVTTNNDTPLCAMVLANGQHMFTCDPVGEYDLTVPLDDNGQITFFTFCDGKKPFKRTLNKSQTNFDVYMPDESVSKTIILPAGSFNLGNNVSLNYKGIIFPAGYQSNVGATVPMPKDWDGTSDFSLTIFFYPTVEYIGTVCFFVRVTGRTVGEELNDPGSINAAGVKVATPKMIHKQVFKIPSSRFLTTDDVIDIYAIQRGGTGETYDEDVVFLSAELSYTAN